jgi:4-amino-4-deoxy-L-arabinose transferase-like glycosyltransferase
VSAAVAVANPPARARRERLAAVAVAALAAAGLLILLDAAPVERTAERRTHAVAAHMILSHDWLVPVENGKPRVQKPPLFYWAAAAAASAADEAKLSVLSLRLPSAVSALALLAVVYAWGRSLGGVPCGAVSALALLQMAQYWTIGRRGVAEMMLALFATSALFAFDRIYWGGRRRLLPVFFALVALGFLTKATTALLLVGLPIALQLALDRSLRRAARRDVVAWAALCVVACLAWYAVILVRVPGAWPVLREALLLPLGLTRSIGSATHARPPWFYLPRLLEVASPALILAPLALVRPTLTRDVFAAPRARFAPLCFASLLIAFSLIKMKQQHYLAPRLPFLSISLGQLLVGLHARRPELVSRAMRVVAAALLVIAPFVATALALHLFVAREDPPAVAVALGAALVIAAAVAFFAARRGHLATFAAASLLASATAILVHEASVRAVAHGIETGTISAQARRDRLERALSEHPWLRRLYAPGR